MHFPLNLHTVKNHFGVELQADEKKRRQNERRGITDTTRCWREAARTQAMEINSTGERQDACFDFGVNSGFEDN